MVRLQYITMSLMALMVAQRPRHRPFLHHYQSHLPNVQLLSELKLNFTLHSHSQQCLPLRNARVHNASAGIWAYRLSPRFRDRPSDLPDRRRLDVSGRTRVQIPDMRTPLMWNA